MFNKVILVGNLTKDIELRHAPSGTAIGNSGLAINRKFKKQDGSQGEEVCFIDITFFGRTAEIANQYLRKGSKVLVEGRLKYDTWEDQNGDRRGKHSIIVESMQMLGPKNDSDGGSGYNNQVPTNQQNNAPIVENNNNYQTPNNNQYNQSQAPFEQQNKATITNNTQQQMPMIDVNDNEIPF